MVKSQSVIGEFVEATTSRTIKNQIAIRGGAALGRGATKMGYALTAESIRRANTPMQHKTDIFDMNNKQFYRQSNKKLVHDGRIRIWKSDWKPNPRITYARRGIFSPPEATQRNRWIRNRQRAEVRRVKTPARAAVLSFGFARAIPILAYGYVAHSILAGKKEEIDANLQRAIFGGTLEENLEMAEYVAEEYSERTPLVGIALRTGFTVGVGMLTGLFS